MRWTMLILNLLAAVGLMLLTGMAISAHRTHAFSTYRALVNNQVLVERPAFTNGQPFDVEAHLRGIAAGGSYYSVLGHCAAGACALNGFLFFFGYKAKRIIDIEP